MIRSLLDFYPTLCQLPAMIDNYDQIYVIISLNSLQFYQLLRLMKRRGLHVPTARLLDKSAVSKARQFLQSLPNSNCEGSVELSIPSGDGEPQVATIKLNNPAKRNALSPRMMLQLADCITRLESSSSTATHANGTTITTNSPIVALILAGAKNTFCTGLDLSAAKQQLSTPEAGLMMSTLMQDTLGRLQALPMLSVAAIDGNYVYALCTQSKLHLLLTGWAMGGGAELTTSCDFRVMSSRAQLQFVQLRMGTSTGWGGGSRLVQLVGRRQALHVLLSMQRLRAEDCQRLGLCDAVIEVLPSSSADDCAMQSAAHKWLMETYLTRQNNDQQFESNDHQTIRLIKQMIHQVASQHQTVEQLSIERQIFGQLWGQGANLKALLK
jgi:ethylmalonyl-CoA/methylmalonyl-CoA decarboxylase